MRLRSLWLVLILLLLLHGPASAGDVGEDLIQRQLADVEVEELEKVFKEMSRDLGEYVPENLGQVVRDVVGGRPLVNPKALLEGLGRYFFGEVSHNLNLLGKLVILAVVCTLLSTIQSAFESEAVASLAHAISFMAIALLALGSLTQAVSVVRGAVKELTSLMLALLPTLAVLVAGMGAPVSAGLLHPALIFVVNTVGVIVADYVIPVLYVAAILDVASYFCGSFKVSGLVGLLRQAAVVVMGLSFSAFLGFVMVNKVAGEVTDSMVLRSTKFLSTSFIPVVGKMFSDAVEVVFSSSQLLRNAVGLAGALGVFFVVALPLLKVLSFIAIYRLAAAAVQPIGAERVASCLQSIAASLTIFWVALAVVSLMCFIGLTFLIGVARPF
ncbi:MAG: stage III sporulation protein AE [Bacillota bacterium]